MGWESVYQISRFFKIKGNLTSVGINLQNETVMNFSNVFKTTGKTVDLSMNGNLNDFNTPTEVYSEPCQPVRWRVLKNVVNYFRKTLHLRCSAGV